MRLRGNRVSPCAIPPLGLSSCHIPLTPLALMLRRVIEIRALAARVQVVSNEFGSTGPVLRSGHGAARFVVSLDFEVLP